MRKTALSIGVWAVAVALPLGVLRAQDEKPGDEKKPTKGKGDAQVQIKVERVDGDGKGKGGEPIKLRVRAAGVGEGIRDGDVQLFVTQSGAGEKETYLGVGLEPVPAALAAQLPNLIAKDQGLLVAAVAADSPAAKAGLKVHDVLVSYDDQKLFSHEQLVKLVRADKAGREVTLGVVRAGKLEKVKVALGEREAPAAIRVFTDGKQLEDRIKEFSGREFPRLQKGDFGSQKQWEEAAKRWEEMAKRFQPQGAIGAKPDGVKVHSSFNSLSIRSLDGDRFKVEAEYKDDKGETKKWSFEGTRDEIRKELEADKDMPAGIRQQLLRSLDFSKGGVRFNIPGGFGGVFMMHDLDDDGGLDLVIPPGFGPPGLAPPGGFESFQKMMEAMFKHLDPQVQEQLKGVFKSIEQPREKPVVREPEVKE